MRIAELTRHLMMPLAVVGLIPAAWAAVPVAVWDGDFNTATKNNVTFDANGNTIAANGATVTIAEASNGGVKFAFDSSKTTGYLTAIVRYANYTQPSANAVAISSTGGAVENSGKDLFGAAVLMENGYLKNIWDNSVDNRGTMANVALPESGLLAMTFAGQGAGATKGAVVYVKANDATALTQATSGLNSLYTTTTSLYGLAVGGNSGSTSLGKLTGLEIAAVAIFDSVLSQEDILGYKWPSEVSDYTANNVSGTLDWSAINFNTTWVNGTDKAAVINLSGDATITLPTDLVANKVTFVGNHTATLVYASTPAVGQWLRVDGATIERIVTSDMINAGFTVDAAIDFVINQAMTPTEGMGPVTVPANATLKIRGCTTTPKFGTTTMKGKLVIEKGATLVANVTDLVEYNSATEVHVYGTLDLALTRQTLFPNNKLYLYGGGAITGSTEGEINNGCHLNTINAGAGVICKVGPDGEAAATISAVIGPQCAPSTIDVEEGLTVTLSATTASSGTLRQAGLIKTGLGALRIAGDLSTLTSIRCDEGSLVIAAGAQPPKVDVASTGTITADNSVAVVLLATDAQLKAGFSTTISGGASVTCVDARGEAWDLTQDGNTYSLSAVTYTFNGSEGDNNWSTAANWSTGKVPAAGSTIVIAADVLIDRDMTLPTITINEGVRLGIAANKTLTVSNATGLPAIFGEGTLKYTSNLTLNSSYTSPFTFAVGWTGTLHLAGAVTMQYGDFNKFIGADKIKLSNASGYLANNTDFAGEIILENANANTVAMNVNNGDSGRYYKIAKLSGNGTLKVSGGGTATQQTVIANADDFTGDVIITGDVTGVTMNRKSVLFGSSSSITQEAYGTIIVAADGAATMANGKRWTVDPSRTLRVKGTLKSTNRDQVKAYGGTTNLIEVAAGGVLELVTRGNQNDATDVAYTNITGTGSIKLSGNGGNYHILPNDPELLWASTLGVINEQPGGMILSKCGTAEDPALYTIGTFSGSKDIRVDYVDAANSRSLRTIMSADAEWSGKILPCTTSGNIDRFNTLYVAGADGATAKTLTISGTAFDAQCPNTLHVEATGAVKLTGNWVGDVSVAGTIGGTGSASGTVTFADGATVIYVPGGTALSATFAAAANATVKVTATDEDLAGKTAVKVLSWTEKPAIAFVPADLPKAWIVIQKSDGLYLSMLKPFVLSIQ